MLYNKNLKRTITPYDCPNCPLYDKRLLRCDGKNKICFLYDPKTGTCIDLVTKMPIKFDK